MGSTLDAGSVVKQSIINDAFLQLEAFGPEISQFLFVCYPVRKMQNVGI